MLKKDEQETAGIAPETLTGTAASVPAPIPGIDYDFHEEIDPADLEPLPLQIPPRRHLIGIGVTILVLLLLALLPPLVNVNRYRRQIAISIGASLGRPVRMDSVSLNLLPVPSFTLKNFIVGEDAAFGTEPVIRANEVRATIRAASLWRGRVEFSSISLTDPSVNLVHLADGRWNIEGILLQASRVPAAPTDQKVATEAPRFPYIEATGARVNVKMGQEKMPLSLTEARLALWLPEPNEWRLRLSGKPARTDTAATDTGEFRLEGSLGRAAALSQMAVHLEGSWTAAPLGAVSWLILGRDSDLRGSMNAGTTIQGTVGANAVSTRLELRDLHRSDFVPAHMLNADIECTGKTTNFFHRLDEVHCAWPPDAAGGARLLAEASFPDVTKPETFAGHLRWDEVPIASVLDALRTASPRLPANLAAEGTLSGTAAYGPAPASAIPQDTLSVLIAKASLTAGKEPPFIGAPADSDDSTIKEPRSEDLTAESVDGKVLASTIPLNLGGPAPAVLDVQADRTGVTLHLTGQVLRSRLVALAAAVPQFGDGLEAILPPATDAAPETAFRIDATAVRPWSGAQTWTIAAKAPPKPQHRHTGRARQ
jgi:AsmA protein